MRLPENIKDKRTTPVDCQDPAVFVCFFLTKCATHARQDQNIQYYIVSLHICSEQTGSFTNEPVIAGCFFHYIFCVLSISMCTDSPYNCFFLYGKLQIPQHSILTKMFKIDLFIIFHFSSCVGKLRVNLISFTLYVPLPWLPIIRKCSIVIAES